MPDAAITMGMVMLCEAASSDLEVGKRKSTVPTQRLRNDHMYDLSPEILIYRVCACVCQLCVWQELLW